jgi:hypothetical protein
MRLSASVRAGLLFLLISILLSASALPGRLSRPLTVDICPTSSFGSYRYGHLHAGIDFSTGGVTGVPVLAVDTCWVWRIRIWNGGYGKALYAQLSDGKMLVYGHLSRYAPRIEASVEREQDLRGAYAVEMYFEPNVFRFLPGDTLGFSGDTGSGPPHLHFELRSGRHDHSKLNPVPEHMDLSENISPEIKTLLFTPLDAGGTVNGSHDPVAIACKTGPDTLMISGPFGVSVSAVDRVQCGKTLTPVLYEGWIDDIPLWGLDLDRFPFSKSHFIGSIYHTVAGKRFVRLFDPYGLDFSGFTFLADETTSLAPDLVEGHHNLSVHVGDAWGNSSWIDVPFYYGTTPEFVSYGLDEDSAGVEVVMIPSPADGEVEFAVRGPGDRWEPLELPAAGGEYRGRVRGAGSDTEVRCKLTGRNGFTRTCVLATGGGRSIDSVNIETVLHPDYLEIFVRPEAQPSSLPVIRIYEGSSFETMVLQPEGNNLFRGVYHPVGTDQVIHLRAALEFGAEKVERTRGFAMGRIMPGKRIWLLGDRYKVRLSAPAGYASSTLVRLSEDSGSSHEGFEENLGRIFLEPAGVFFNERVELLVVSKEGDCTSRHGAYAERGGSTSFLGRFDSTGVAAVKLRSLVSIVVLADEEPPSIVFTGRLRRRASDGKGLFSAKIRDGGSGLDSGSLKGYVDDDAAIVSYDPDTGRVSGRSRKPLKYGTHAIRLEVKDRIGNSATGETTRELAR